MLWYKGWLETRIKLLMAVGWMGWFLAAQYMPGLKEPAGLTGLAISATFIAVTTPMLLAGAGIATQPAFQATKGLHGSTHFTLSLPVSRLRLLLTRAGLGWFVFAGAIGLMCSGMWILFPVLRAETTSGQMCEYAGALLACASGFYSIGVLLATFLDEIWRIWAGLFALAMLWLLFNKTTLPASANIFRAMGQGSPLVTHAMPWTAMAFSLGLGAVCFFGALKIVVAREY
ncbi:MAG TPA: hypothetical protein VGG72_06650 [Bryobacteraceae bacterium]|jgi:hypothetical protein